MIGGGRIRFVVHDKYHLVPMDNPVPSTPTDFAEALDPILCTGDYRCKRRISEIRPYRLLVEIFEIIDPAAERSVTEIDKDRSQGYKR